MCISNVRKIQVSVQVFGPMRDTTDAQDCQNTEGEFLFLNELSVSL